MKKLFAVMLSLCMLLSSVPAVFAEEVPDEEFGVEEVAEEPAMELPEEPVLEPGETTPPEAAAPAGEAETSVPDAVSVVSFDLVNNQCIQFVLNQSIAGMAEKSNYTVITVAGAPVTIAAVTACDTLRVQMTFPDPLAAGTYQLQFRSGSTSFTAEFTMSLSLKVIKVVDARHMIIQLNEPIYGCTTPNNYFFHSLAGEQYSVTEAVSAFQEMNGELPNVFKLTTDKDLKPGTTYVVETRNMALDAAWEHPCQGTIAYITTPDPLPGEEVRPIKVVALTNNQSVIFELPAGMTAGSAASAYMVKNASGAAVSIGNVQTSGNRFTLNFASPLPAGNYTVAYNAGTSSVNGSFEISLDLKVLKIEPNAVIIQLSAPVYGCTDVFCYFAHKLNSSTEISCVKAESVFAEMGGTIPNVFRVTFGENIVVGQTYILETRRMSLDASWEHPCQGTIAYFTQEEPFPSDDVEIDGVKYELNEETKTAVVIGYTGTAASVEVKGKVTKNGSTQEYTVTEIGTGAFQNNTTLTSIVLPNSITVIRASAFAGCSNLASMESK